MRDVRAALGTLIEEQCSNRHDVSAQLMPPKRLTFGTCSGRMGEPISRRPHRSRPPPRAVWCDSLRRVLRVRRFSRPTRLDRFDRRDRVEQLSQRRRFEQ